MKPSDGEIARRVADPAGGNDLPVALSRQCLEEA
jgi:hypothetical protein